MTRNATCLNLVPLLCSCSFIKEKNEVNIRICNEHGIKFKTDERLTIVRESYFTDIIEQKIIVYKIMDEDSVYLFSAEYDSLNMFSRNLVISEKFLKDYSVRFSETYNLKLSGVMIEKKDDVDVGMIFYTDSSVVYVLLNCKLHIDLYDFDKNDVSKRNRLLQTISFY